jgi:benzoyl-CoA reductase/2-hydroxyglutaryl-CoA dehydratase subunit BcrC/BadD/HgdB
MRRRHLIATINNQIKATIDKLKQSPSLFADVPPLDYFYRFATTFYQRRAKELQHEKEDGRPIIGTFCCFAPEEVIYAADAIPIRLTTGTYATVSDAEVMVPRLCCPLIKSTLGFILQDLPFFKLADVIIVPTACWEITKLGELLADHKPIWVLGVPYTQETVQARELWLQELLMLKKKLEALTGNRITAKRLRASIELCNRKRSALQRLYELRKIDPPPIKGSHALLITYLSAMDDPIRWTEHVNTLCTYIETKLDTTTPITNTKSPRVLLTGSPLVFPSWKIPLLLEESGAVIVADDLCTGAGTQWTLVRVGLWSMNEMMLAIANRYLTNTCACFIPNKTRLDRLMEFITEYKVDGIYNHVLQTCLGFGFEEYSLKKRLDAERYDIPVLTIETDFGEEDIEPIRTRIEVFVNMMRKRKEG